MQQPGLHNRHRDKNGEISRKHANRWSAPFGRSTDSTSRRTSPMRRSSGTCSKSSTSRPCRRWCTITSTGTSTGKSPVIREAAGPPRPQQWRLLECLQSGDAARDTVRHDLLRQSGPRSHSMMPLPASRMAAIARATTWSGVLRPSPNANRW